MLSFNLDTPQADRVLTQDEVEIQQDEQNTSSSTIFFVVLRYSGQQGAGVSAITSLQCWAGHTGFPIKIVEPTITRTEIVSTIKYRPSSKSLDLGDYFDLVYLNSASKAAGYAEILPRKEYAKLTPKYVVVINVVPKGSFRWSSNGTQHCYRGQRNQALQDGRHCIVEIVSVDVRLLDKEFPKVINHWKNKGLTVVIGKWMGTYVPNAACKRIYQAEKYQFRPSLRVLNDAHRYTEKYVGNRNSYTAVMLRLEHTAMLAERNPGKYSIDDCLKSVVDAVEEEQGATKQVPMIAADLGEYGSNSFSWAVKDKVMLELGMNSTKRTMLELLDYQLSFEEWEESFVRAAGGVANRGYIAALQRTIASQAKCLVLMGGGTFQDLALQEYVRLHSVKTERCIHLICIDNRSVLESRL